MRFALLAVVLVALAAACADDTPSSRSPAGVARPMDEPRAQEVIARTFKDAGVEPEAGRTIALSAKDAPKLEVAAAGHKYGVIWLTRELQQSIAAFLPKHENDEGALVVLDGAGVDAGGHALVLWESDYMTDDLAGVSHSSTEIAAERKLERDVREFLLKAKTAEWP
jgi:hypothetical protein